MNEEGGCVRVDCCAGVCVVSLSCALLVYEQVSDVITPDAATAAYKMAMHSMARLNKTAAGTVMVLVCVFVRFISMGMVRYTLQAA